jgi:hypothetical protein
MNFIISSATSSELRGGPAFEVSSGIRGSFLPFSQNFSVDRRAHALPEASGSDRAGI